MRKFTVSFRPAADTELIELYDYIATEAGSAIAAGCVDRIERVCLAFQSFPFRGKLRAGAGPGIRTLAFERRATIVYRVRRSNVLVVRVLYGGRDVEALLRAEGDE